jgi:predicted HTH domain antitoxin
MKSTMAVETINLQVSPESLNQGEQAIRQEIAVQLYAQEIFTFGQSRHLANLSVWEFQNLLGQKRIPRRYDEEDLAQDIATIQNGDW